MIRGSAVCTNAAVSFACVGAVGAFAAPCLGSPLAAATRAAKNVYTKIGLSFRRVGWSGVWRSARSIRRARADCPPTVSQTQGPYWVDEMLNRSDVRSDPVTGIVTLNNIPVGLYNLSASAAGFAAALPLTGKWMHVATRLER